MNKRKIGVLVLSYGTPESLDQVEAYYTHIRRGVPPAHEQLEELVNRYRAIVGGVFPLREITNQQVNALEKMLNQQHPDTPFICYQGLKHAYPFVEDGIKQMANDGIQHAIGVVLAPHYSSMSVATYVKRAQEQANLIGLPIQFVYQYHVHPKFLQALSIRIQSAINKFNLQEHEQVKVIFTAHSLPTKILEINDPYPEQLLQTAQALVAMVGIDKHNWQMGWQSAGRTATPWLGPDILDIIRTVHEQEHVRHILVCPIGFVSDHLEVLYDIDIECQALAKSLGIHLERTDSLNTDPLYIETLSDVVYQQYVTATSE
jgi:ferrochelatase